MLLPVAFSESGHFRLANCGEIWVSRIVVVVFVVVVIIVDVDVFARDILLNFLARSCCECLSVLYHTRISGPTGPVNSSSQNGLLKIISRLWYSRNKIVKNNS